MNKMQGCVDCNNCVYSFDIELVDELEQPISDIDYELVLEKNNLVLAKGKTDGKGEISVDNLPSLPLRLVLDTATFLKEMQAKNRHLRLGRTEADSKVKLRAEQQGREYSYATVGQLINELPIIPDWPEKRDLPAFHFPDKAPKGWSIRPRGKDHKQRKLTIEVCPFRAWVLMLHNGPEYSLVNGYNLSLMSILAYAGGERDDHGSKAGALKPYVEQVLTHLGRLPFKVNDQYLAPVVKDVPFSERYRHYEFIDSSSKEMGEIGDTQLLYLVNNEHAVVAWRGTASMADGITDLTGIQWSTNAIQLNGKVHLGFINAYQKIFATDELDKAITSMNGYISGKPLFICGHSLGGALALIHAAEHRAKKPQLYTYGMPRVFDRTAIAQLDEIVHYRHINNNDLITAVPHPKWGSMRVLLALSTALLPYPTPQKYSPEVRRYLDAQDYQHHGKIIHFVGFSMNYDTGGAPYLDSGTGYESRGRFAAYASQHRKAIQIKTLLAPSLIGANDQKTFDLVTKQYSRQDLDNPERNVANGAEHPSSKYAHYLGERLYDRLCQKYETPSNFEIQANKIKQVVHSSIDKDKPAELNALLQADARLLEQSLLPITEQPIELNGLERCYNYAMQQPKEAIRSERAELAKENQQLVHDSNYQLHSNASYLEPGMRATLPALNEDMEQSIKLAKQQSNGIKEMDTLLQ